MSGTSQRCSLSRVSFSFDFERPAAPDAASQMGGHRLSRPSTQSASVQSGSEGRIFCVSRTNFPGKAARPRNRNRCPRRSEIEDSGQVDQGRRGLLEECNQTYYGQLLSPNVEFVGEIGERDKGDFLGNADALLFPIDWPEPSNSS